MSLILKVARGGKNGSGFGIVPFSVAGLVNASAPLSEPVLKGAVAESSFNSTEPPMRNVVGFKLTLPKLVLTVHCITLLGSSRAVENCTCWAEREVVKKATAATRRKRLCMRSSRREGGEWGGGAGAVRKVTSNIIVHNQRRVVREAGFSPNRSGLCLCR